MVAKLNPRRLAIVALFLAIGGQSLPIDALAGQRAVVKPAIAFAKPKPPKPNSLKNPGSNAGVAMLLPIVQAAREEIPPPPPNPGGDCMSCD